GVLDLALERGEAVLVPRQHCHGVAAACEATRDRRAGSGSDAAHQSDGKFLCHGRSFDRWASRSAAQAPLEKLEAIVAEEHVLADDERRRSEDTPFGRELGVFLEKFLVPGAVCRLEELPPVEPRCVE